MTTGTSDAGATSADQEAMPPGVELLDLEQYLPPMDPGVSISMRVCMVAELGALLMFKHPTSTDMRLGGGAAGQVLRGRSTSGHPTRAKDGAQP